MAAVMGKDRPNTQSSQSKIDKFAVLSSQGSAAGMSTGAGVPGDNATTEILKAIHDSRVALEAQIGGVQSEVSLIRQDLWNTVDRVTEVEGHISELEDTIKDLSENVRQLMSSTKTLEARAKDVEKPR